MHGRSTLHADCSANSWHGVRNDQAAVCTRLQMLDADPCSGPVAGMPPGWAGTPGYIDPMYEQLGQICDKSGKPRLLFVLTDMCSLLGCV